MGRIPLIAKDGSVRAYTLVDDADEPLMLADVWRLHSTGRAWRTGRRDHDGRRRPIWLARWLLALAPDDPRQVDHVRRGSAGRPAQQPAHRHGSRERPEHRAATGRLGPSERPLVRAPGAAGA